MPLAQSGCAGRGDRPDKRRSDLFASGFVRPEGLRATKRVSDFTGHRVAPAQHSASLMHESRARIQPEAEGTVAAGGLRMGNPRRPLRHYAAGDPDGTRTDGPQAAQPHLTAHTLRLISDTLCKIETLPRILLTPVAYRKQSRRAECG
jgi:hypothetical protein